MFTYKIVQRDVENPKGGTSLYVNSPNTLTDSETRQLRGILLTTRRSYANMKANTSEIVMEALRKFEQDTGIKLSPCQKPYIEKFVF